MKKIRIALSAFIAFQLICVGFVNGQEHNINARIAKDPGYVGIDPFLKFVVKKPNLGNKAYVVLPTNIEAASATRFKKFVMAMVHGNPNLVFIVTGSAKEILNVYTIDVMTSPNVVIDSASLYQKTGFSQNVPQAFYYDKGVLSKQASIPESRMHVELMTLEPYKRPPNVDGIEVVMGDSPQEIIALESEAHPNYNKKVSEFQLKSLHDKIFKLSEHKGKVIVVNFWTKGCANCVLETPDLNRISALAKKRNFVFLSIGVNSIKELVGYIEPLEDHYRFVRKFRDVQDLKFDIFPNGKQSADLFQISGFPQTIIIDKEGKLKRVVGYMVDGSGQDKDFFYNILTKEINRYL